MTFGDKALPYINLGIYVAPAHFGLSRSFLKDWPNKASIDPIQIDYWDKNFPNGNVIVVCGPKSGLSVLDVDRDHGKDGADGFEGLADLAMNGKKLPDRPTVRTPSGGAHLYFKYVHGITNAQGVSRSGRGIAPGVDFKTTGGSVAGAGSVKNGISYEWAGGKVPQSRDEIPKLPDWAIEMLQVKALPKRLNPDKQGDFSGIFKAIKSCNEGRRNGMIYWAANRMKEEGATDQDYMELLNMCRSLASGDEDPRTYAIECAETVLSATGNDLRGNF